MARRVYWDSCTFLGLINEEIGKHTDCMDVWGEAEAGKTIILTSFFTFAEVYKAKCEGKARPLDDEGDRKIEAVLQQSFVEGAMVDEGIGVWARRLMRKFEDCKKPSDAIHLATALRLNSDEMHTFDGSDLLRLDGLVEKANGELLTICTPAKAPAPPPLSLPFISSAVETLEFCIPTGYLFRHAQDHQHAHLRLPRNRPWPRSASHRNPCPATAGSCPETEKAPAIASEGG